ncbi:hypothetical protein FRC01_004253, partial [Tulasnella sp. 417]
IAVSRLPEEIWTAVFEALLQLDLFDSGLTYWLQLEAQRANTNPNRLDPIFTAHSILYLSQTCRYLHKVTPPFAMKYILLRWPRSVRRAEWSYRSWIRQIQSVRLNSNQRLQLVTGLTVEIESLSLPDGVDPIGELELRSQIHDLLIRLPNLRHLTVVGIA